MTDDEDGFRRPERKPRAKRGRAKVAVAIEEYLAEPPSLSDLSPAQGLQVLDDELSDEEAAVSVLRPSVFIFLQRADDEGCGVLDPSKSSNQAFLAHQVSVEHLCEVVASFEVDTTEEREHLSELAQRADRLREDLRALKIRAWQLCRDRDVLAGLHRGYAYDNTPAFADVAVSRHGPSVAFVLVVVCVHLLHHTTVELSQALLTGLRICLAISAVAGSGHLPRDLRTALSFFPIDADVQAIACCPNPECCKLHLPDEDNKLPERCDATFGTWSCNWVVSTKFTTRAGKVHSRPIRAFHFQSVTSWIGHLLARPGIEQAMEDYVASASSRGTSVLQDIWDSPFLRRFRWQQGHTISVPPGFVSADGELRLLFSLAIDWFTAHGGKQAGKKWSIGAIYLVCQNLPLEIRFKPENVCLVGIIPGRTKPLGSAVNSFLRKLVDEFVAFYERGIWYTQTFQCASGRLVRAALGPVVCDLDAARGVAGFGAVSHTLFCSLCNATRDEMGDFDSTFAPRGGPALQAFPLWTSVMRLWRRATSIHEQDELWKEYGIRWTELARLSYWNPFQFLVIDVMHCLFLGLFRRHFRYIWKMDVDTCGWGDEVQLHPGQYAHAKLAFARRGCKASDLKALSYDALQGLAQNCDAIPEEKVSQKKDLLIETLLSWKGDIVADSGPGGQLPAVLVIQPTDEHLSKEWLLTQPTIWPRMTKSDVIELAELGGIVDIEGATKKELEDALRDRLEDLAQDASAETAAAEEVDIEPSVKAATGKRKRLVALGRGVLTAVSKDIQRTVLPDWLDPAPVHVGNTKHGKLSANHWRSLCTIHCVITLIRLWGLLQLDHARYLALENFIYLVKAVQLATMRTTTRERREAYSSLLKRYLNGIKVLYSSVHITPNHHLATHIPEFLKRFGPPHSWWAFPYERYNGMLQRINTNDLMGSMEKTILTKFTQASRLRCLIIDGLFPDVAKPLLEWASKLVRKTYSGTLMADNDAAGAAERWFVDLATARPSAAMAKLLSSANVDSSLLKTARSIRHRGMTFGAFVHLPVGRSTGNCIVHVLVNGETAPARIREIAYKPRGGDNDAAVEANAVYVFVDLYGELSESDTAKDPYRRWRKLNGFAGLDCHLRYNSFDRVRIVELSDLVCHAAMCEYEAVGQRLGRGASVFLGLNRNDERGV